MQKYDEDVKRYMVMWQICNELLATWDLHPIYVEYNFILENMQPISPRFDLLSLMILVISFN